MSRDLIDQMFQPEPEDEDLYPGSRHKRREGPAKPFPTPSADLWREDYTTKTVGGRELRLYTIGAFAEALGVSVVTIRRWTKRGFIPQAPYRLPSTMKVQGETVAGRRLYTADVIDATVAIFRKHGVDPSQRVQFDQHPGLSMDIIDAWSAVLRKTRETPNR